MAVAVDRRGLAGGADGVGGFLLANWFFSPPYTLDIADAEQRARLLVVLRRRRGGRRRSWTGSAAVGRAGRARPKRSAPGRRARPWLGERPRSASLARLGRRRRAFGSRRAARATERVATRGRISGRPRPDDPGRGGDRRRAGDGIELVLDGAAADGRRSTGARRFAGQLAVGDRARPAARRSREGRRARRRSTGCGRRCSRRSRHDLRTPLGIDQGVGLQPPPTRCRLAAANRWRSCTETIDAETDRLNRLIGNLLDMSRLAGRPLAVELARSASRRSSLGAGEPRAVDRIGVVLDVPPRRSRRCVADPIAPGAGAGQRRSPTPSLLAARTPVTDRRRPASATDVARAGRRPRARDPAGRPATRAPAVPAPRRPRCRPAGVGLGLAIAHGFVDAMRRRARRSTTRPAVGSPSRSCPRRRRSTQLPSRADVERDDRAVLVVDDEPPIRRALGANLGRAATRSTAATGEQALPAVATEHPDVVAARPRAARHGRARASSTALRGWSHGADHRAVRPRRRARQGRRRSTPAPTTTSPSRSAWTSCWPGCGPHFAAPPTGRRRRGRCRHAVTSRSTWRTRGSSAIDGDARCA